MTLILMAASDQYVVQLSDRRFTSLGHSRTVPESNKGGILLLPDARLVVGFSGLARYRSFVTQEWLLAELQELSGTGSPALGLIDSFVKSADQTFQTDRRLHGLSLVDRRVTFMISGFAWFEQGPRFVGTLASNFQDWESKQDLNEAQPTFMQSNTIEHVKRPEGMAYVQRIGAWQWLSPAVIDAELKPLLAGHRPVRAVIDKGVQLIREVARQQPGVGEDVTALAVGRRPEDGVTGEFHSASVSRSVFMPDMVDASHRPAVAVMGAELRAESVGAPPLAVPKVGRNRPCPCGSGTKYKRCHGRSRPTAPPPHIERR